MSDGLAEALARCLAAGEPAILVKVLAVRGSAPREAGAAMLVTQDGQAGTIGGGALEWDAAARARELLASGDASAEIEVPLGPEIGQCCGGRVRLSFALAGRSVLAELSNDERRAREGAAQVLVFGAGHVGRALATALAPLPLRITVVDPRRDMLDGLPDTVSSRCSAVPEAEVRHAPAGAAFVVLTHSHGLDFSITEAALVRRDAAYVGMIGSKTKRAQFVRWMREQGHVASLIEPLVMPIGGTGVRDKRPSVIAALVAAELTETLLGRTRDCPVRRPGDAPSERVNS